MNEDNQDINKSLSEKSVVRHTLNIGNYESISVEEKPEFINQAILNELVRVSQRRDDEEEDIRIDRSTERALIQHYIELVKEERETSNGMDS